MLKIVSTNKFKRDFNKAKKRGLSEKQVQEVISLLRDQKQLPPKYKDHKLNNSKKYSNCRECHISPDWLLIYQIKKDELILKLIAMGSHSDLFEESLFNESIQKRLDEVTRKNLVGKTKYQSKARYLKRKDYTVDSKYNIDVQKFINEDRIAITAHVGKYECTVAFDGVLENIIDQVQHRFHNNLTLQDVYKALWKCIDDGDIFVDCQCDDYKYRFRYWATRLGYQYGSGERRPAHITNPRNNIGSFCKHLTRLLSDKSWLKKCSSVVNLVVKDNIEEIREAFGLEEDELTITDTKKNLKQYRDKPKEEPQGEPDETIEVNPDYKDEPEEDEEEQSDEQGEEQTEPEEPNEEENTEEEPHDDISEPGLL